MVYPLVRQGNYERIRHDIPLDAYRAWLSQYNSARRRKIEFEFAFLDWWKWWQVDNRWAIRGRKRGCVMMARIGDAGPYAPGNVYAATHKENAADAAVIGKGSASLRARWAAKTPEERAAWHLAVKGERHPKSKAVIDPAGRRFGCATEAAEAHYYTRQYIAYMARHQLRGWHWENEADRILAAGAARARGGVSP